MHQPARVLHHEVTDVGHARGDGQLEPPVRRDLPHVCRGHPLTRERSVVPGDEARRRPPEIEERALVRLGLEEQIHQSVLTGRVGRLGAGRDRS